MLAKSWLIPLLIFLTIVISLVITSAKRKNNDKLKSKNFLLIFLPTFLKLFLTVDVVLFLFNFISEKILFMDTEWLTTFNLLFLLIVVAVIFVVVYCLKHKSRKNKINNMNEKANSKK